MTLLGQRCDPCDPFLTTGQICAPLGCIRTRVSPSGARGSVIQEPNLDPDVLMVMGSLMPVSLPHAGRKEVRWDYLDGYYNDYKFTSTTL